MRTITLAVLLLTSLSGAGVAQSEAPKAGADAPGSVRTDGDRTDRQMTDPVTPPTGDPSGVTGNSASGTGPNEKSETAKPAPGR